MPWLAGTKHCNKNQLEEKRVNFCFGLLGYISTGTEVRAGTQGKNLEAMCEQKKQRISVYWVVPHGFLSLLFYTI